MAYDGFYAGLSTRGSANEILNLITEKQAAIDASIAAGVATLESIAQANQEILDLVIAYQLAAVYKFIDVSASTNYTIAFGVASVFRINMLTEGNFIIDLSDGGFDTPGQAKQITVILKQGVGGTKVTWPSNVKWANGNPPTLSFTQGKEDIITFLRITGDTKWYGFFNGSSF